MPDPVPATALIARRKSPLDAGDTARWRTLEQGMAVAVLIILGLRITMPLGTTAGYLLALGLIPLWFRAAMHYRLAPLLLVLGVVAGVMGGVLSAYSGEDHDISRNSAGVSLMLLVGTLAAAGFILWVRTLMRPGWIAAAFGLGMLLGVSPSSPLFDENPWKFGFSLPVTIIALGLASLSRRRWPEVAVLIIVIPAAALNDARSNFAILLLTLLATLWQARPTGSANRGASAARTFAAVAAMGYVVYSFGQALILDGYLGQSTQERSRRQIETSGNLLLGARPELGATSALMKEYPNGFGLGVVPSSTDIGVAKEGMAALGYDPDNNYVEGYMFGDRFELHSALSDFWADFGVAGLVFGVTLLVVIAAHFTHLVAANRASAVLTFLVVQTGWNFLFSPLYGSVPNLILVLGLVLLWREDRAHDPRARQAPLHRLAG